MVPHCFAVPLKNRHARLRYRDRGNFGRNLMALKATEVRDIQFGRFVGLLTLARVHRYEQQLLSHHCLGEASQPAGPQKEFVNKKTSRVANKLTGQTQRRRTPPETKKIPSRLK